MSKTVGTLFNAYGAKYNIKQLGGTSGLDKAVTWAYLAEDIGNFGFLKSGELIITTGYFTLEGISLSDFIKELIDRNFAGMIINTGKYITEDDITPELVSLCEEKAFPLFTMPWEVQISSLMQDICGDLISVRRKEKAVEEAVAALLKGEAQSNGKVLENSGFSQTEIYRVAVFQKNHKPDLSHMPKKICLTLDGYDVCVYTDSENFENYLNPSKPAGISSPKQSPEALSELFEEAKTAFRVSKAFGGSPVFYEKLGLLRLILKISDKSFLKAYMTEKIGALITYDVKHESNLTETLFYYILSGASPAETAKIMYTHRNTVNYRINKIRELLNDPLTDFEDMAEILAAIYILRLTSEKEILSKED